MTTGFLPQRGNYRDLLVYRKASRGTELKLRRPMDRLKRDFLEGGGIREEMTRARLAYRRRQELNGANGTEGTDWANE